MRTDGFSSILCDPERIRTFDLLIRSQLLYPAELRSLKIALFEKRCKYTICF